MKKSGTKICQTTYATFKGADFSTDPSLVQSYRSPLCTNIIADAGGMPQKRLGWRQLQKLSGAVYGLYAGNFSGTVKRLAHVGTKLYLWDESGTPTVLSSAFPAHKSRAVFLKGKLWITTGAGYFVYDGSTVCKVQDSSDVYVPTTIITREPTGGGTTYEDGNMLTGKRKNAFQTDGTSKTFTVEDSIDSGSTVTCWVWGEVTVPSSIDYANGKVTFSTAPAAPLAGSADGLVIEFCHTHTGYAEYINQCTICTTFGVGTNDRVVVAGNPYKKNVDWISGLNDPTYFPDLGYSYVGSEATAILGYCRIGNQLGIVKEDDGQDSTVFLRSGETDEDMNVSFPLAQAVAGVGAVSEGSFASLMDDPLFLSRNGIMAIASNSVTSEKIAQSRSFYVNAKLTLESNLDQGEACVWNGMYLLGLPNGHVYCMDGRQEKTYRSESLGDFVYECYYWEDVPIVCWLVWKTGSTEALYFGTADGRICKFNSDLTTMDRYSDGGTSAISAVWATKFDDDGTPAVLKTLLKRGCCVTIKPYNRSSGTVFFRTDRTKGAEKQAAEKPMDILDFADIDFERFTFNTDDAPQEIYLNRKVKNYKRLQIIVRNSEVNEGFGVFQITKHFVKGNFSK